MTATLADPLRQSAPHVSPVLDDVHHERFTALLAAARPWCETAVDSTDIAVLLETEGINDAIAASSYGARDTHALAEKLLSWTPTRVPAASTTPMAQITPNARTTMTTQHSERARLCRRGLLYAAPGCFYLGCIVEGQPADAGIAVIGVTTLGWSLSQVLALLGHRLMGRSTPANAHAVLRQLVLVVAVAACAGGAMAALRIGAVMAGVLSAQVIIAAAAALLLFLDADTRLGACLLPGATVAMLCAVVHDISGSSLTVTVAAVAAMGTAVVTVTVAWLPGTGGSAGASARMYPSMRDWLRTAPFVLYCVLCAAALLGSARLASPSTGPHSAGAMLTVLPIVLIMGFGEWQLRRLRITCAEAAAVSTTVGHYRRAVCRRLVAMELRTGSACGALSALVTAGVWLTGASTDSPATLITRAVTAAVLACAVIGGLVSCALSQPWRAIVAFLTVDAATIIVLVAAGPLTGAHAPAVALVAVGGLWCATHVAARATVRNPIAVIG